MDINHRHSKLACLNSGFGHRIRNIMIFQIEKNLTTLVTDHLDHRRATAGKELLADLEHAHFVMQL